MRKSVTLGELLIAVTLLGVIILGTIAFDTASRELLRSSERRVEVVNDATFILEHIHKNVLRGIGDITSAGRRAVRVVNHPDGLVSELLIWQDSNGDGVLTPGSPDRQVKYIFDRSNHTVTFEGNLLIKRLLDVQLAEADGGVRIADLTLVYDPTTYNSASLDPRNNPVISVREQFFFPFSQSLR